MYTPLPDENGITVSFSAHGSSTLGRIPRKRLKNFTPYPLGFR
jgi:hypothetical protein